MIHRVGVHPILVRASDFGSWDYCQKQYHLVRVLGCTPDRGAQARLERGQGSHERHGATLQRAHAARRSTMLLFMAGLLLLVWLLLTAATSPVPALAITRAQVALLAAAALAVAVLMWHLARGLERRSGLPGAAELVATDAIQGRGRLFIDRKAGLVGKPDYLRRERDGGLISRYVAAEVKPNRAREEPYYGDVLQLVAYVALTISHYGPRAARYGYLAYRNRTWRIEADDRAVQHVRATAEAMRAAHELRVVHRSHTSVRRCQGCSVRGQCSESVAH